MTTVMAQAAERPAVKTQTLELQKTALTGPSASSASNGSANGLTAAPTATTGGAAGAAGAMNVTPRRSSHSLSSANHMDVDSVNSARPHDPTGHKASLVTHTPLLPATHGAGALPSGKHGSTSSASPQVPLSMQPGGPRHALTPTVTQTHSTHTPSALDGTNTSPPSSLRSFRPSGPPPNAAAHTSSPPHGGNTLGAPAGAGSSGSAGGSAGGAVPPPALNLQSLPKHSHNHSSSASGDGKTSPVNTATGQQLASAHGGGAQTTASATATTPPGAASSQTHGAGSLSPHSASKQHLITNAGLAGASFIAANNGAGQTTYLASHPEEPSQYAVSSNASGIGGGQSPPQPLHILTASHHSNSTHHLPANHKENDHSPNGLVNGNANGSGSGNGHAPGLGGAMSYAQMHQHQPQHQPIPQHMTPSTGSGAGATRLSMSAAPKRTDSGVGTGTTDLNGTAAANGTGAAANGTGNGNGGPRQPPGFGRITKHNYKEYDRKGAFVVHDNGVKDPEPTGYELKLTSGVYGMQGARTSMEDKHSVLPHPEFNKVCNLEDATPRSFFAVYDGHGGYVAAEYSRQHVHKNFVTDAMFGIQTEAALKNGLLKTEHDFCSACRKKQLLSSSGTCAVVAYLQGTTLVVANVGDSRCVLSVGQRATPLSIDHKPARVDERERIEQLGGRVGRTEDEAFGRDIGSGGGGGGCTCIKSMFSDEKPLRIFPGGLSVSRTIGDIALKATQLIVAEPELTVRQLTLEDNAVILACDGVWDVMSDAQAGELVRKHLDDPTKAARMLSFEAYRRGSKDNISVIIVALHWVKTKTTPNA